METWILFGILLFLIFLIYSSKCECRRGFRVGGENEPILNDSPPKTPAEAYPPVDYGNPVCCEEQLAKYNTDAAGMKGFTRLKMETVDDKNYNYGCNMITENFKPRTGQLPNKWIWNTEWKNNIPVNQPVDGRSGSNSFHNFNGDLLYKGNKCLTQKQNTCASVSFNCGKYKLKKNAHELPCSQAKYDPLNCDMCLCCDPD